MYCYKPHENSDERFASYRNLEISFVLGITGWSWEARNDDNEAVSSSGFLDLDLAIENALTTLGGNPTFRPSPFNRPFQKPLKGESLAEYLDRWSKDHG